MLKRHEVEILLKAGHAKAEIARLSGVSLRSVQRIAEEDPVLQVEDEGERRKRRIGRPSTVQNFRKQVVEILEQEPDLATLEILRRARETGYEGGKTALYALVASLRPKSAKPLVRFEGLPGEFRQHDFGQVEVNFVHGWLSGDSFFRLAIEVLALHARQFGEGSDGRNSGADVGRAPGELGRASAAVCV